MTTAPQKDSYTAALIVIGNEILSGRTQDTNSAWIGQQLMPQGIMLRQIRVVPDIEDEIISAIHDLRLKVDYVFTTGGIGPTHDDITAAAVAKAFGVPVELNDTAYQMLVRHYGSEQEVTPARKKMAMVPKGSKLIVNAVSGAPGFQMENVFVMAGVPRIMQSMFEDVKGMLGIGKPVLSNTITCSLTESVIAAGLAKIQNDFPDVAIGSYPSFRGGILGLSLVLRSNDPDLLDRATNDVIALISELGGEPNAIGIQSPGNFIMA